MTDVLCSIMNKYANSVTVAIYLFSWDINVEHMLVFLIVYDFHCLKVPMKWKIGVEFYVLV